MPDPLRPVRVELALVVVKGEALLTATPSVKSLDAESMSVIVKVRFVTGRSKVNVVIVLFASLRSSDLAALSTGAWCSTSGLVCPPTVPDRTARFSFSDPSWRPNRMLDPL